MNKSRSNRRDAESAASSNANVELQTTSKKDAASDNYVVLQAINSLKEDLIAKIEENAAAQSAELCSQVDQLRTELRNAMERVNARVEAAEERVTGLESAMGGHSDSITTLEKEFTVMKKELAVLKERSEDLEARDPQPRENPTLGPTSSLRNRPTDDNEPPRAFVVRCHYFSEKEDILKKAIEMKLVTTAHGDRIQILPDFTQTVSKQRAAFNEVRSLLRNCEGVRFGLRYPAVLRITTRDGKETSFKDPVKAKDLILKNLTCKDK
ncbi:hypothetical protein DPX16_23694 [Anabarilius grahami]|uniref:LINE-1 type transposase domain-containing protein 1 n=1 Tax=Anabarilius grahami TaxID=495550 RepID=A0A3N0XSB9_ANAGA|nr:hypothetical protein DPX16_23694 [Anabarilius grahami]